MVRITKITRFSTVTVVMVVFILAMMAGCKKNSSESQTINTTEKLRFVWLADSRGDSLKDPIRLPVLKNIILQIAALNPPPDFVVFGGDGAYRGFIGTEYTFDTFKHLFDTLINQGIPLYTAIGNHELYHEHSSEGSWLLNQQQFQSTFSENPKNGPAGYDHLTYSFVNPETSSLFVVLDPYFVTKDTMHLTLGGNIDDATMTWLRGLVASNQVKHKFMFIHTPYYYISNDTTEPSSANQSFTKLWAFIDSSNFDLYACGHSHLYSRRTISDSVSPNPQTIPPTAAWKNNVVQLINGTCGAGPSTEAIDPNVRIPWHVYNDPLTYYFSVIDVSGSNVLVNSYRGYTGAYTLFDSFTISK